MKNKQIQTILRRTLNSRLLFNTKKEGEDFIGIVELSNLSSKKNEQEYTRLLSQKCEQDAMIDLETLIDLYTGALNQYKSDNGLRYEADAHNRRARREIRRRLAVRLFIWTYLGHTKEGKEKALRLDRQNRFPKDTFKIYCPVAGSDEKIDVCFTVLFNWDIIHPEIKDYENKATSEYKGFSTSDRNQRMLELLGAIRAEMPRIGIFGSGELPAIDLAIKEIQHDIKEDIFPTSAQYWLMLRQIGMAALASVDKDTMSSAGLSTYHMPMPGIWKDDADCAKTRFWIFPYNYQYAFCYEKSSADPKEWILRPYEFFVCTANINTEDYHDDYIVWIEAAETESIIRNSGKEAKASNISYLRFNIEFDNEDQIKLLELKPIKPTQPKPLPWTKFERIRSAEKNFFYEAKKVLKSKQFILSGNNILINKVNAIIGLDTQYLYLYEYPDRNTAFFNIKLTEKDEDGNNLEINVNDKNEIEKYVYVPCITHNKINLFDISEGEKFIAIPRDQEKYACDKSSADYDYIKRLCYAIEHTMIDGFVTIYNFGDNDDKKIIFFDDFSVGVSFSQLKRLLKLRKSDELYSTLSKRPQY